MKVVSVFSGYEVRDFGGGCFHPSSSALSLPDMRIRFIWPGQDEGRAFCAHWSRNI